MSYKIIFQTLLTPKTQLCASLARHSRLYQIFPRVLPLLISIIFVPLSHSADLTIAWDHNDQTSVTGYYVYYGFESGSYLAKEDAGSEPQYTIVGLDDMELYYIAVTAYNDFGESDFSEEIIAAPNACNADIDFDGDIDGTDLILYAEDSMGLNLDIFIAKFGSTDCP